jgi:UDP-N-acetylmuramate dehydrogenase
MITFDDLDSLRTAIAYDANPKLILGGGSNILFTKDFEGTVLKNEIKGISLVETNENHVIVEVGAGEIWHSFVKYCIQQNWGGIENLSLIPGTCGAAPIQNIGAYGVELKDILVSVTCYDIEASEVKTFDRQACQFGYRDSYFKHHKELVVLSMRLRLSLYDHVLKINYGDISKELDSMNILEPTIQDISNAVIHIRQSKLPNPAFMGNAGSFFKNPIIDTESFQALKNRFPNMPWYPTDSPQKIKIPAGWLIEQAGFKGVKFGQTGSHKDQALVIVNYGQATGTEIKEHAHRVMEKVHLLFGIKLTPEVNII